MDAVNVYRKGNKVLKIYNDDDASDPRGDSNICKMVCFHRNYNLGDKHNYKQSDYNSWEELKKAIIKAEKVVTIAPLYLYDHSGLYIKVGSFQGTLPQGHAEFDTMCVGFIYVTLDTLTEEFDIKRRGKKATEKAEYWINVEMKTYSAYVEGSVYGFKLLEVDEKGEEVEELDSCWGFYGYDIEENGILDNAGITKEEWKEWKEIQEVKTTSTSYRYEE